MADNDLANTNEADFRFHVRRLYVKDSSFEAPNSPESFKSEFSPKLELNMSLKDNLVEKETSTYEVALKLTVSVSQNDKVMFVVEVEQAGLFEISGPYEEERLKSVLRVTCPSILFPYVRTAIDNLVVSGSFPALMLAPLSFDSIYAQALEQEAAVAAAKQ